jgi:hypothetical protein
MNILKLAAFSHQDKGRNLAGVAFCEEMPADEEMLKAAREVGYSERAFLVKYPKVASSCSTGSDTEKSRVDGVQATGLYTSCRI